MKVNCDECKKDYEMKIRQKIYRGGIQELYFRCPHCRERYTSFFTDFKIRKKQREIKKKHKIINSTDNRVIIEKTQKDISDLRADLRIDIHELKETMMKRLNL